MKSPVTRHAALSAVTVFAAIAATANAQAANSPPVLKGTIPTSATARTYYTFKPYSTDADGDVLTFRIQNKPSWATFDASVGRLRGTPSAAGRYSNVSISVTDGHYTRTLGPVTITVAAAAPAPSPSPTPTPTPTPSPSPSPTGTLAERYPGDVGIEKDAAVIFRDAYEDSSTSTLGSRYQTVYNLPGVSMVSDKPAKSRGSRSVKLTSGVKADTTGLYRNLGTGYDEVYLRYYTKYVGTEFDHSGMWFGGYNPALNWGNTRAGHKPTGSDRFSFAIESNNGDFMDIYTYWMNMRSYKSNPVDGDYFGNIFINRNDTRIRQGQWTCYEVHVKLNPDPSNDRGAVLEMWENDQLLRRFDDTGPYGWWGKDKFCPHDSDSPQCAPYAPSNPSQVLLDRRWRSTTALKVNHIWPTNYNVTKVDSNVLFDDLVLAKSRVGCLK